VLRDCPNTEWVIDFKGRFRTGNGMRCDLLTITDVGSRNLLDMRIMAMTGRAVLPALTRKFEDYDLPDANRSDTGAAYGSRGAEDTGGLLGGQLGVHSHHSPPPSKRRGCAHWRQRSHHSAWRAGGGEHGVVFTKGRERAAGLGGLRLCAR
jgi:transposase InsO family protein